MAVHGAAASEFVKSKLDEFFWEWLSLPEAQKIVRQALSGTGEVSSKAEGPVPSPHFSTLRGSPSGRPSPPGSPARGLLREQASPDAPVGSEWSGSAGSQPSPASPGSRGQAAGAIEEGGEKLSSTLSATAPALSGSKVIPRFWTPKLQVPPDSLPAAAREKIHTHFAKQAITDGIRTHQQLEPIVTEVFRLSKYFVVPIFHKIKVFYDIGDASQKTKASLLAPSPVPITEQMLIGWCSGKICPDDPVLSFFYIVKKEHNDWIEREDFTIFLTAILLTHPGLEFLRETQEFQDRYADTVISRIFFVYDRKGVGRIYLMALRRYKPYVTDTWQQLAENDDIKMVREYFSYEQFYVIYCTFWELDSDHDFLLDKDDLLKYDGHALSRRTVDRIFSEIPTKFTTAVPGKMGYEDFIRFLLCDQDRQTDRSMEYWFYLFDLDGDGVISDSEMKYFYEEQVQRMECLNYDTIPFADIMCQMNDMISPEFEGHFRLTDFKKKRKFAGIFFSLFSSLNKFLAFEHRDPFLAKQEQMDNPSFNDWDRWCADEYLRLAMEENEEPEEDAGRNSGDDS